MEYNYNEIEKKWQDAWQKANCYRVSNQSTKPKYYVLDMFPYPSGAGLHVGHPLGYIASDIFSRYKRLKGFNVLHPMGYDAFGLPAEQYAIEHGIHPSISTQNNIANFRKQLDKMGFCYDWDRAVNTSKPEYYKWTQWIFLQLFNSFFNKKNQKATPIAALVKSFETEGNLHHPALSVEPFNATQWQAYDHKTKQHILMQYRLAYCGYGEVNWCEALGTVLANDEVVNGVSERGGHLVVKKKLRQWYLRITDYADRLQHDLQSLDWSDAMKEMQTNWIGKSSGAEIQFQIEHSAIVIDAYTTRPDTIFGVDFLVIAPEHDQIAAIITPRQKQAVEAYIAYVKSRTDRDRQQEKKISGVFTGAFVTNPFSGRPIPVWISEYVLIGYGTGAIMAVPCGDERDYKFARHFNIPITNIIGSAFNQKEANPTKDAVLENSDFLDGLKMKDAIEIAIQKLEALGIGKRKTNYKMRDAAFSRQRYWGEPFPIVWKDGVATALPEAELPLLLPQVENYTPGPNGAGPLANIPEWVSKELETNTMPGYAGSSWYFLRYMDPQNEHSFCDRSVSDYWNQVDLYIGGTEHAVGHLLYSRMWTKALFDLGFIGFNEPFKKLLNQGMIQGSSRFVYRLNGTNTFVSLGLFKDETDSYHQTKLDKIHVDVSLVDGYELDIEAFKKWKNEAYADAAFLLEDGSDYHLNSTSKYICGAEVEKMSKTKFNTVNPDDLVAKYGADTFRMYEMFLGPVEVSKPWDTKGIEGVHRFLKKLWRLFFDETKHPIFTTTPATTEQLKTLHKTIKKIEEDTERFSFNTAVSAFMICVNELAELKCSNRQILEPLLILITPYAPHIAEQLWQVLGNTTSILDATFPAFNPQLLVENTKEYPISINGKMRTTITFSLDALQQDIEQQVLSNEIVTKWLEGGIPKKIIFVKNKMINVVV